MAPNAAQDFCSIPQVSAWLRSAEVLDPLVESRLRNVMTLHAERKTRVHNWPMEQFLIDYSQLRDWASLPCPEFETWVRQSNICGINPRLERAFHLKPTPTTILDQEPVVAWFRAAVRVNEEMCRCIFFAILRKAAGSNPSEKQMESMRAVFISLNTALSISCQQLAEFLGVAEGEQTMADPVYASNPLCRPPKPEASTSTLEAAGQSSGTAKQKTNIRKAQSPPPTIRPQKRRAYAQIKKAPPKRQQSPTLKEMVREALYAQGNRRGAGREYELALSNFRDLMWSDIYEAEQPRKERGITNKVDIPRSVKMYPNNPFNYK